MECTECREIMEFVGYGAGRAGFGYVQWRSVVYVESVGLKDGGWLGCNDSGVRIGNRLYSGDVNSCGEAFA